VKGERGQAAVELVGMLPLLFLTVLAACQVLVAGLAREAAHHAAQAGAMALLQGGDPAQEARAAAPDWSRHRLSVSVSGRTVRVRVVPPAPALNPSRSRRPPRRSADRTPRGLRRRSR